MKTTIFLLVFLSLACIAHAQGKIQDGLCKIYKGNDIQNLATVKKLNLNGVAFQYHKNGDVQRESWYEDNQLHGLTSVFSSEKKLVEIKVYKHGHLAEIKPLKAAGDFTQ